MNYPPVEASRVQEFLRMKGFASHEGEPFIFRNSDMYVAYDEDQRPMINLNYLIEDWTILGAKELADELIVWLGANPNI